MVKITQKCPKLHTNTPILPSDWWLLLEKTVVGSQQHHSKGHTILNRIQEIVKFPPSLAVTLTFSTLLNYQQIIELIDLKSDLHFMINSLLVSFVNLI